MTAKVWTYKDWKDGSNFLSAMHSGQVFECDEEMFYYWLEVLPPARMGYIASLPNGEKVQASFGFAEGAEPITAFWRKRYPGQGDLKEGNWDGDFYFGCRTNEIKTWD